MICPVPKLSEYLMLCSHADDRKLNVGLEASHCRYRPAHEALKDAQYRKVVALIVFSAGQEVARQPMSGLHELNVAAKAIRGQLKL